VTAIIGPSGCGKSTFPPAINRMNDLIPGCRAAGELLFDGQNVYGPEVDAAVLRRRVGMVFQKPNPFPKSIYDNVAYGRACTTGAHATNWTRSLSRAGERRAVGRGEGSPAHECTGAFRRQAQRLCLARALAVKPEILLMDEPTSALDPKATARIEELIVQLRGRYTIAIVTHNMQQAARVSDRTAFFYEGNLVEFDATETLFTRPREKRTEDYITGRFG
jgi:phosphate transport system ATP-binding protein